MGTIFTIVDALPGGTVTVGPAATVWVGYGLLAPATEAQTQTMPPVSALDRDAGVELADFADEDQESVISDNDLRSQKKGVKWNVPSTYS